MADGITGIVTKPVKVHHEEKRRQGRAAELQRFVAEQQQTLLEAHDDKTSPRTSRASHPRRDVHKTSSAAQKAAAASAMSVGLLAPRALKGLAVDFPLAITEGLRSVPSQYGDQSRNHSNITGVGTW